jgi:antitoxin (DNA-binding transcriptional repressor) of toxin-antitoxin stability system
MHTTSLFDAKTHLSKIIADLVDGTEDEVRILRRGKPVATLTAIKPVDSSRRVGCAKGKFQIPADIDQDNPGIQALFNGEA